MCHSFWESYDQLKKPVKAGVRTAMAKVQQSSIAELYADQGLHLESVTNAPDDGSNTFLLLSVLPAADAEGAQPPRHGGAHRQH